MRTAGEPTRSRSRSAMFSITGATSGELCSRAASSARIVARPLSSRDCWFNCKASSAVQSCAARMLTRASATSPNAAFAGCRYAIAPTTSPANSNGAATTEPAGEPPGIEYWPSNSASRTIVPRFCTACSATDGSAPVTRVPRKRSAPAPSASSPTSSPSGVQLQ